ncbi:MAG: xanthine dehydrogenase family protein subunit M [Acidobacteria bacterium]|nr:xanthine dehydrogenase family protein subunit M [Acidobacteriota bacterium]
MFPANFNYVRPNNIREAVQFLNEHKDDAKVLAGGQSLIPMMKLRLAAPEFLVDIGRLPELKEIDLDDAVLTIGSLIRHADIETADLIARACPLLAETAAEIGDAQVRNRGTIGGSLAHADPSADLPATMLVLDARFSVAGPDGRRIIMAEDFFTDVMTTALRPNEILVSIEIPKMSRRTGCAYVKMHQQASGFAIVGVASLITLGRNGRAEDVRVGINGVSGVPYRAHAVEESLRGKPVDERNIAEAAALAAQGVEPLSDIHASSEYRREMATVYARRSLQRAAQRASAPQRH